MRRLTLILSDLYLPEEAMRGTAIPATLALPQLEWLLRFANHSTSIADWRSWLATDLRLPSISRLPPAQVAAAASLAPHAAGRAWLATPVHLAARLDHVRLVDRGLLRVGADEQAAWCESFAHVFGPELMLHAGGERGFFLTGLESLAASTVDPARLLDADVAGALPHGEGAATLRRLGAEIEMWLHAASINTARERAQRPRISALWLWGGAPKQDEIAMTIAANTLESVSIYGGDPFLAGLARIGGLPVPATPPVDFSALDSGARRLVLEFAPMSGAARESLGALDANWFAPARVALSTSKLGAIDIVANDRCFHITPRAGLRFWRRRRGWLDILGHTARTAKA